MGKKFKNPLKDLLKKGEKTTGAWVQIGSSITAEILGSAGFDWLIMDLEHGSGDIPTLINQIQATRLVDSVPLVRAPWNDFVIIKRILDAGAYGVIVPNVETKEEAQNMVKACKYPPEGIRGVSANARAAGFGCKPDRYFSTANDELLIIAQIETQKGVNNLDKILEVGGLDGIFIGPSDLAASMGYIGNPGHSAVQEAIATVETLVFENNKILGTMAGSWEQALKLYDKGYQMLTLMADGASLAKTAGDIISKFRELKE
jgi:2-keto-3-deoxy-L-rhamnonate aldolase RhmA